LSPQLKLPSEIVIDNDWVLQIRPVATVFMNTSIAILTTSTTVLISPEASYSCIQHEWSKTRP
jgi:hypothetical protein